MKDIKISLSVVSHGHRKHVEQLIDDLLKIGRTDIELILTLNIPEELPLKLGALPFPVRIINNEMPKGFAANHNQAYVRSGGEFFILLNPDIRLVVDPFSALLDLAAQNHRSIVAPMIVNEAGEEEDSARSFPTPAQLLQKLICKLMGWPMRRGAKNESLILEPDWVAGMFIMIGRALYEELHGLDERYFLYYEDVDFCMRARLNQCRVLVTRKVKVIHHAQRDSHKNFRFLLMHLRSAARFFTSGPYLKLRLGRWLAV